MLVTPTSFFKRYKGMSHVQNFFKTEYSAEKSFALFTEYSVEPNIYSNLSISKEKSWTEKKDIDIEIKIVDFKNYHKRLTWVV